MEIFYYFYYYRISGNAGFQAMLHRFLRKNLRDEKESMHLERREDGWDMKKMDIERNG